MSIVRRPHPAAETTPDPSPRPFRATNPRWRRQARRAVRTIVYGVLTGAATAAGKAALAAVIGWIHHH